MRYRCFLLFHSLRRIKETPTIYSVSENLKQNNVFRDDDRSPIRFVGVISSVPVGPKSAPTDPPLQDEEAEAGGVK